jgi:hypothetical protein
MSAPAESGMLPSMAGPVVDAEPVTDTAPEDPLNWPASRRWIVTAVLSASGFNRIIV